jgi:hypothetical protein
MSRERLWVVLAVVLPVFASTIAQLPTGDLAYQVRAGELMLSTGALLRADPFTFTAFGEPWTNQQWATGLIVAIVHGAAGWGGLALLRAVLIGAIGGLVFWGCRAALDPRRASLLALAGFLLAIGSLALRAQLFGIVCFAVTIAVLARRADHPRLIWLLPVVAVAWANLHGSFFLAPIAVGAAVLDDLVARRPDRGPMLAVLALSSLATCLTPFGPGVWSYALSLSTNPTIARLVSEWQRTSPLTVLGVLYYGTVLAAVALIFLARRRGWRIEPGRILLLIALAALGAFAERGVVWWALGAPVALAPAIAACWPARSSRRVETTGLRRANAVVAVALIAATVLLQPVLRPGDRLTGPTGLLRDAPAGLARTIADHAGSTDRVVVPQPWASWFEWAAPGRLVMVDSRIELFDTATWEDYLAITRGGQSALPALDRVGATLVVVDPKIQPDLRDLLDAPSNGWQSVYSDADGTVYAPR